MSLTGILEVKECPHGKGVFALKDFAAGDLLRRFDDILVTKSPKSPAWKRWAMIIGRTENACSGTRNPRGATTIGRTF